MGGGLSWNKRQTLRPQGLGKGRIVLRIMLEAAGERARLRDYAKGIFTTHDRGEGRKNSEERSGTFLNSKMSLIKELRMRGRCETEGRT